MVKKYCTNNIIKKSLYAACLCVALMSTAFGETAWTKTLQVGGTPGTARIIFEPEPPVTPLMSQEDQTLIVNFPNTIGEPALVSDAFIIENLRFNGKTAHISMKKSFTYKTSTLDRPYRFIIDIVAADELPADICPIEHIETNPHDNGVTVAFFMNPDQWPEIRSRENERMYFLFEGTILCSQIQKDLLRAPYIDFAGTVKTQRGTGLIFSFTEENASYEITTDEINNKIIIEISTTEQLSRSRVYSIAKKAFDQGDIAATIHTLERCKETLDPKESILLGKAYWLVSFPYHMEGPLMDAFKFISEGIQTMVPGAEREQIMLEYTAMLLRTDMYTEARNYIRFLKESTATQVALLANIQEIDMMNKTKLFQDAFVENRRLRNEFDLDAVPKEIKGYYLSVVGDTYLGLNAYSKALRFYNDAIAEDPALFSYDPELYSHIASASYSLKDFAKAKEYLLLAINLGNPANKADHLLEMGDCLYQLGEKEKAMSIFAEVENISPKSDSGIIAKLRTARILRERDFETQGKLTDKTFYEIMDIYESLKATDEYQEGPLGSLVKIRIAQTFSLKEDWDSALEAYYRAWIDTKKDDPIHKYAQTEAEKTILSRLKSLYQEDNYDLIYDLYTIYEDSFMQDITEGDALFILGDSMRRLDYPDKARPLLITVTKGSSERKPQAIATLFTMDYSQGDYSQALQWNSAYLLGYPDGPFEGLMRETRGELLYHANLLEEATLYLEPIAAKGDETSLKAMSMLADIHRRLKHPQKEASTLEEIIAFQSKATSPIIERALYARAKQLIAAKDNPRAETLLHEMIDTYPESSYKNWARYHLATIAHAADKHAEARSLLTSVMSDSTDSVLINMASSYLKEMDLVANVDEFNQLKNRFGGN